jgi:hypothetical protein
MCDMLLPISRGCIRLVRLSATHHDDQPPSGIHHNLEMPITEASPARHMNFRAPARRSRSRVTFMADLAELLMRLAEHERRRRERSGQQYARTAWPAQIFTASVLEERPRSAAVDPDPEWAPRKPWPNMHLARDTRY